MNFYEPKQQIDEYKPQERVLVAVGRKQGDHVPYDAPRPSSPAKIEVEDREAQFEQLQQPPTELGYDEQAWSAKLLLHYIKEEYGVEYHEDNACDLLREAMLSVRTVQPCYYEADTEEKAEFQETVRKDIPN